MILLTDVARERIKKLVSTRGYAGIRIGVKTTGCSGLAYVLEYVQAHDDAPGVINFSQTDFVLLVSQKDLPYLDGMTVDWVRQGLNEGFNFINKNERDRCGCGESFRV
jgi:iron-sulfur cluster assembly protein